MRPTATRFKFLLISLMTGIASAGPAQGAMAAEPIGPTCAQLSQDVLGKVSQLRSADAGDLFAALSDVDRLGLRCAGVILNNVAALFLSSGRLTEAEATARRAVHTLEESLPPDDPALLRPLQILAAVEFERGSIARARQVFKRMQAVRATRPEDRELVSALAASLLDAERRWPEAESQYRAAIQCLREAGRGETAEAGALLNGIGAIYIRGGRMTEAREALKAALAIFERAPDATPWDRAKLLRTRAALSARLGHWSEAEEDLSKSLSAAELESRVEPQDLRSLLIDYAVALRKNHRRREARRIEAQIRTLGGAPQAREVVDVTALLAGRKVRR